MYTIKGTTITLTKGDSFYCQLVLTKNNDTYTPEEGDVIQFAMKKTVFDSEPVITKTVPNDTLILALLPADTKTLADGKYIYDLEITFEDGDVDTFINQAEFNIVQEVLT